MNHANSANSINEDDVQRTLDYQVYWRIPFDRSVAASTQLGQPVVLAQPGSRVSQSITALAQSLCGSRGHGQGQTQHGGLFSIFGRRR